MEAMKIAAILASLLFIIALGYWSLRRLINNIQETTMPEIKVFYNGYWYEVRIRKKLDNWKRIYPSHSVDYRLKTKQEADKLCQETRRQHKIRLSKFKIVSTKSDSPLYKGLKGDGDD